jgi:hypothetical protein
VYTQPRSLVPGPVRWDSCPRLGTCPRYYLHRPLACTCQLQPTAYTVEWHPIIIISVPHSCILSLVRWCLVPSDGTLAQDWELVPDTTYIGHSLVLANCNQLPILWSGAPCCVLLLSTILCGALLLVPARLCLDLALIVPWPLLLLLVTGLSFQGLLFGAALLSGWQAPTTTKSCSLSPTNS